MILTEDQIFEHAFVVSVDEKRLAAFRINFENAKFKKIPTHWHGAHVSKNLFAPYENKTDNVFNYKYIRCLCNGFSHYFLVVLAKLYDWPFVTIFEDDAFPVDGIHELIKSYCSDIPDNVDIFKLGYLQERDHRIKYEDNKFISVNHVGSHAFIVFKKYYDDFIAETVINPRADFLRINPHRNIKVYSPKVPLFIQKNIRDAEVIHDYK